MFAPPWKKFCGRACNCTVFTVHPEPIQYKCIVKNVAILILGTPFYEIDAIVTIIFASTQTLQVPSTCVQNSLNTVDYE